MAKFRTHGKRHGRPLEAELKKILETASRHNAVEAYAVAARIRREFTGRAHGDSVELLAEDGSR